MVSFFGISEFFNFIFEGLRDLSLAFWFWVWFGVVILLGLLWFAYLGAILFLIGWLGAKVRDYLGVIKRGILRYRDWMMSEGFL